MSELKPQLEERDNKIKKLETKISNQTKETKMLHDQLNKISEDLDKTRKINVILKTQLEEAKRTKEVLQDQLKVNKKIFEELEETKVTNIRLKTQVEEARRIEEILKDQLDEKERTCHKLEMEVIDLRKKDEKNDAHASLRIAQPFWVKY